MKKIINILTILLCVCFITGCNKTSEEKNNTDALKVKKEYESLNGLENENNGKKYVEISLDDDNPFTYVTASDIVKKVNNKETFMLYLGFPECPWCCEYVKYLNEVALANDYEKIYYKNILDERKNNTDFYQELIKILDEYLQYDDEGNKRIYVPAVIAVKKGKIVGFDDETSLDTKGYETPQDYWQNEDLVGLKEKLRQMMSDTIIDSCTSDCNK